MQHQKNVLRSVRFGWASMRDDFDVAATLAEFGIREIMWA
jgi:hypothetical protein